MPRNSEVERADVYSRITAEIIAAIKAGAGEWRMPWHHDGAAPLRPVNILSRRRYRGINTLALWVAAQAQGYASGLWGTYRQWQALGAQVRKGERGTTAVLWKSLAAGGDEDEDEPAHGRVVARAFTLFNVAQVDDYVAAQAPLTSDGEQLAEADAFIAPLGIPVTIGAYDPHYRIDLDRVFMPPAAAFADTASHLGTLLHESAHATGAKHRLDRNFDKRFGLAARAVEECVAELTASYVLADLGVACQPRADHAAYISAWLRLWAARHNSSNREVAIM